MRSMRLAMALSAVLLSAGSYPLCARADEPTLNPSVNVQPIPGGGVVVTPSVGGTIPISPNVSINANVQAPIIVPQSGPAVVAPPSVSIGGVIRF